MLAVIVMIAWVAVAVIREAHTGRESVIVNHKGEPYRIHAVSKPWAIALVAGSLAIILLLSYGTYFFYRSTPQALLDKYPLGFVVFKADYITGVFPYREHYLLDRYVFNWPTGKIDQSSQDFIRITMPDMIDRYTGGTFSRNTVETQKRVGPVPTVFYSDGRIEIHGEIIAINQTGVIFAIGFKRAS
jgi:hypothetical protein